MPVGALNTKQTFPHCQPNLSTVTECARFRLLLPELQIDAQGSFERSADGGAILDRRWFAKTKTDLWFPYNRLLCLPKLAAQWAIDQWIRREEQELDWVRRNQELLTRGNSNTNAGVAQGVAPSNGSNPTSVKPNIKSPQPMQPTERPAKVTKIIFD